MCRTGNCPWTFFAFPTSLADEQGLPPDDSVCEILSAVQKNGISVGLWIDGLSPDTTYFCCRKEDITRLNRMLNVLQVNELTATRYLIDRCEELFV